MISGKKHEVDQLSGQCLPFAFLVLLPVLFKADAGTEQQSVFGFGKSKARLWTSDRRKSVLMTSPVVTRQGRVTGDYRISEIARQIFPIGR
jgi:hypothetical protein